MIERSNCATTSAAAAGSNTSIARISPSAALIASLLRVASRASSMIAARTASLTTTILISRSYLVANSQSRWSWPGTAITAPVP